MKRVLWVVALVGCGGSGEDFPVAPGGPGGGPNTPLDAALIDAPDFDALSTLAGRVCLLADPRTPTVCADTGAKDITVTLGTKTTTTAANGSFTIARPSGSNLTWRVEDVAIVTSLVPFGTSNILPAMTVQTYADLQGANSVIVVTGSLFARVIKNMAPQAGVNATVDPLADSPVRYANNAAFNWPELATGTSAYGMLWIPNAVLGPNTVTATPDAGAPGTASAEVEDQAITYMTIELP